jgi:selenocysteine lyase/cysteine desulfurase
MKTLEEYFRPFRENTIGYNQSFNTPYGEKKLIYADWIASGRLYLPIEERLINDFGPFVGNTHSESNMTGTTMTRAYKASHDMIKNHVKAGQEDVIITAGFGMTAVINKLQRILGLRIPEKWKNSIDLQENLRPLVFITHMEHHSNHTSWLETICEVRCIHPDKNGMPDLDHLADLLEEYKERPLKIGSFSACSNVTGISTEYHKMAKIMHENNGICFVDFAASAPYVDIDMHPPDPMEKLDGIFFSPHKFLGGPGSPGVMIFNSSLYENRIPDNPGGGTVTYTNPWNLHKYISDIEIREDGGTPGFLQAIKAALSIKLKDTMGVRNILLREHELLEILFTGLEKIPGVHILEDHVRDRLGVLSFYVEKIHYNLMVKLLNDRFGIQVRGGCSCAGTYGHYLLHVSPKQSKRIEKAIEKGNLSVKPGWLRISLHPTMTEEEVHYISFAIEEVVKNYDKWENDYDYDIHNNSFVNRRASILDTSLFLI